MPVNTDVTIPANSNTKITTTGEATGERVVVVDPPIAGINPTRYVEVRVDPADGTTAAIVTSTINGVRTPQVLYTTSADGTPTFGGKGKNTNGNVVVTTEQDAKDAIATITIDGQSATQDQVIKTIFTAANKLSTSSGGNALVSTTPGVTPGLTTVPVVPGQAEQSNNDSSNAIITDVGDKLKDFVSNLFQNVTLSDAQRENLLNDLSKGRGDDIKSGVYPFDNTYGEIRGQDYVTIDQFLLQPPRGDQIFGSNQNPVLDVLKGAKRLTPLKKFIAQVKLPMPNNISDSNSVAWGEDIMNNMSATITQGIMQNPLAVGGAGIVGNMVGLGPQAAFLAAGMQNEGIDGRTGATDRAQRLVQLLNERPGGQALAKVQGNAAILGMIGVAASPEAILSRGFGVVPNSNLELLFNNVTLRSFQFSWRMSPRDEKEALEVKKIIRFFKQGMAAKTVQNQAGDRSLYLGSPNVFRLQYRTTGGRIIEGVNRIKPCAVVGTAVNYTPDGSWAAYDEGQPVSCTLSIQMKELEPVFASDYSENVIGSRRSGEQITREQFIGPFADPDQAITDIPTGVGDLYRISPNEVGY